MASPRSIDQLVEHQIRRWQLEARMQRLRSRRPCLALSRLPGSGADELGRLLADRLHRGVGVHHVVGHALYSPVLEPVVGELGPFRVMRPAERELRSDLEPLIEKNRLEIVPHEGWLTSREQFESAFTGGKRWRMDRFYRHVRRETGILMSDGKPMGGKLSFDTENRRPWRGEPPAPTPPRHPVDPIKQEVIELVEAEFTGHPGRLEPGPLAATAKDAERAWRWARRHCLEHFGPYEDAMSRRSKTLFHTQISALLNLHRLLPAQSSRP